MNGSRELVGSELGPGHCRRGLPAGATTTEFGLGHLSLTLGHLSLTGSRRIAGGDGPGRRRRPPPPGTRTVRPRPRRRRLPPPWPGGVHESCPAVTGCD
jgi:hypothetical protein